jgi:hypothetical protein
MVGDLDRRKRWGNLAGFLGEKVKRLTLVQKSEPSTDFYYTAERIYIRC